MENLQTKALVESAIFAGVTALLGLIYYYTQYLGIIALVWPIPVIIVGYRNGLKASILSAMTAGLIVSLLTHPLVGVGLLIGFGLPGVLMGYLIKKRVNPIVVMILCGVVLSLTMVGEFLISLITAGISLSEFFSSFDTAFIQQKDIILNIYRQFGIPEEKLQQMSTILSQTAEMMKLIFPSAILLSGLIFSFVDYKLVRLIMKRTGHVIPDIERFSRWRIGKPYSFILIGMMVLAMAASYFKLPLLTAAAYNVVTVLMLIFTVLGLSVLAYYAGVYGDRHGIPRALRNVIIFIIALLFMQLIAYIGIFDMILDVRKLESENREV